MSKVVLITGASRGLGLYTAQAFLKKGYTVYGTSRSAGNNIDGIKMLSLDVCEEQSCEKAVAEVIAAEGRIDVLVNNAGYGVSGPSEYIAEVDMVSQFDTNFFGVMRMTKLVLPHMRKNGSGIIINIGSVAGIIPLPFQSMYSASKAAVESFSQAVNFEAKPHGVRHICIEFGDMKTGFTNHRVKPPKTEPYTKAFLKSVGKMEKDEQNAPLPIKAARFIVKTAEKKRPKPVYVCGFGYKCVVLLRRILPLRISDFIIKKFI